MLTSSSEEILNDRSPVKLSLVQSGGLVYTLYGSTTNDIVTSEQRGREHYEH